VVFPPPTIMRALTILAVRGFRRVEASETAPPSAPRRRARARAFWLSRLDGLQEDLARVADSDDDDPTQLLQEAARRATGAAAVRIEVGPADGDGAHETSVDGREVVAASAVHPGLRLRVRLERPPPRRLAGEHAAFLRAVADHCAQANERAMLRRAERRSRDDLEFLARATTALAASLDVERVTATIEDLVVPYLADSCRIEVIQGARRLHAAPTVVAVHPPGLARIELRVHGELVGVLELWRHGGAHSDAEQRVAELLAAPAARALAHALLFAEQVRTSSTLEHSLLPAALLPIPNLEVGTRYLPATEGHAAGGDFYDVLQAPSGGAVLVVGDVQGKGVEAATLTSTARHTLRTAALGGAGPAVMLERLNDALLYGQAERLAASGQPTVRFVTVCVATLTPTDTGFRAVVASGGHPPPLVVRPDGTVERVRADGPLLGVFDEPAYVERSIDLRLSDVLLLYTDGVTEQRQQPDLFDEAQLGRLVRNMLTARRADDVAQLILDTVTVVSPREVRDDIALVVARVTGPR
jgi:phosphoserine phosphatase RsbU/P